MKRALLLLALTGCGPSEDEVRACRDYCGGYLVKVNPWGGSASSSCVCYQPDAGVTR